MERSPFFLLCFLHVCQALGKYKHLTRKTVSEEERDVSKEHLADSDEQLDKHLPYNNSDSDSE